MVTGKEGRKKKGKEEEEGEKEERERGERVCEFRTRTVIREHSKSLSTLLFDTESDTDLKFTKEIQLTGQTVLAILLSLPPDTPGIPSICC